MITFMSQRKRNKKQKKKKSDWKLDRCYVCKEKGHFPVKCPVRAADTRALMAPYLAEINDQLNWVINKLTRYAEYERQTQQAALETYSFGPVQPAEPSMCDTSNFNGISEIPVIASSSTERPVPRDSRVCVHLEHRYIITLDCQLAAWQVCDVVYVTSRMHSIGECKVSFRFSVNAWISSDSLHRIMVR